jgi:serine/threonine protein phosphatase 1
MSFSFIGDVHGWHDRVLRILPRCSGLPVFVGDLVDRGPASRQVLEDVKALCEIGEARCVMGNHEYALVRALGVPELGIPGDPLLFDAWVMIYGGDATVQSLGCADYDPDAVRSALGDLLPWMAQLPWYLDLSEGRQRYIVVHAGLSDGPLQEQLTAMDDPRPWWRNDVPLPPMLYERRIASAPCDLPRNTWVVSGHTPLPAAVITGQRVLCDTSGGRPGRHLSAINMPEERVVTSR